MKRLIIFFVVLTIITSTFAGCQSSKVPADGPPETEIPVDTGQAMTESPPDTGQEVPESTSAETSPPETVPVETIETTPTEPVIIPESSEPGAPETEATTPPVTECDHSKYKSYDEVTTPTCEKAGSKITRCKNCDAVLKTVTTPALGHIYTLVEGTKTEKCSRCGATRECQHVFKLKEQKAPTCAAVGSKTEICEKCGYDRTTEIPKTNSHTFGGWTTVTAATCAAEGRESRSCSVCGKTETRSIGKTAHSWGGWAHVAPTCTEKGYDKRTCTVCGASETQNEIPALGHNMKFTKTVEATYDAGGYDLWTCTRCGATEKRNETPKLDKPKHLDINEAMAVGNQRLAELGFTVDTSKSPANSAFYPYDIWYGSWINGQSHLNGLAKEKVEALYERLMYSWGYAEGVTARCYIEYHKDTDEYWIFALYS